MNNSKKAVLSSGYVDGLALTICTMYCVDGEMHSSNSIDDPLNILYVIYFYHRCDDNAIAIAVAVTIALPYLLLNLNVEPHFITLSMFCYAKI